MRYGERVPVLPLVLFPSSLLRQAAMAVDTFGTGLDALASDVRDTLCSVAAIGMTAPHIGVLRRVVVVRMAPLDPVRVFVNPTVLWSSNEEEAHEEGSVSMPGVRETLLRPARIRIAFQDLTGAQAVQEASGFEAAVLQHELDQLNGIFWIERLSRLKRDRVIARFAKAQRRDRGTG